MRAAVAIAGLLGLVGCKGAAKPSTATTCTSAAGTIAAGMLKVRADIGTAGIDPAPEVGQLCTDDGWEPAVIRCYAQADGPRGLRLCSGQLTSDQRVHARELQETLYRRASEVGAATSGEIGIGACDDYMLLARRYLECPNVSESVRASFEAIVDDQRVRWTAMAADDSQRDRAELDCTTAGPVLAQRVDSDGC